MFHKKLLEVLSRLDPAEIKSFRLFLESPYFNNGSARKALLELFDVVMQYGADEEHPELSKERMFKRFYPERVFVENAKTPLDSIASDLFLMLKKFLHQRDTEKKQIGSAELLPLLQFYRKNGMEDRFERTLEAARKLNASVLEQGADFYYQCFRLEEEVANFKGMNNTHEDDNNLFAVHQNLDRHYALLKLEYLCATKGQTLKSGDTKSIPPALGEAVFLTAEQYPEYLYGAGIQIFLLIFKFLDNLEDEELLLNLNELLLQHKTKIPKDIYRSMQAYYRFAFVHRLNKPGDPNAVLQAYQVANHHLNEGYFYVDDKILPLTLRFLTVLGIRLKRFDWLKQVLDDHPPARIGGTRFPGEVHNLHYAEYLFELEKYDEAIGHLMHKPFENPHLTLLADLLMIKVYFVTESPLLEFKIKALDQKVRRTKLAAASKASYFSFLKILEKIIKYAWDPKSDKNFKIKEDIIKSPNLFYRSWLLSVLEKRMLGKK